MLNGFRAALAENNYDAFVAVLAAEVTAQMEKAVLKSR